MQTGWRPPGAIFFLLRRRKNMERKTPLRAGGPALRTHPLGGCRWCGWVSFVYQADLRLHPCPDSWYADRLPLRCSLRTAGVTWGMAWSEDCCIERWSRCARALAAVCVRARSAVGCLARRVRQRSSWVRAFTQNACKKFFSSSSSHPPPALARGLLLSILN